MRLVRRSIRGGWNVPRRTRRRAVNKLDEYLDSEDSGLVIDTVKALAVLDNADLKTEAIAAQREKANANASSNNVFIHTGGDAAVVVQQALNDPEYVAWRRSQAVRRAVESGALCGDGEPRALGDGAAPGGPG
ncbi:MAG: hypothetical protein KGL35_15055 [Bradyrhizobium sp.]|nr:hypothetical protein [Bradyrhizobium sp.]